MIDKRLLIAIPLTAVVLVGAAATAIMLFPKAPEPWPSAAEIVATLDPECLGCGTDAYHETPVAHAMAFGLLASVGAEMNDNDVVEASANWLVENSRPTETSVGWGLDFGNDAFGDGTENPAETVYGITTSIAVTGLLDAYETLDREVYLTTAIGALDYYSSFFTETENGGYFWYSDQPWDDISTYNVSAMLMGQYARAAALVGRTDFAAIADAAWGELKSNRTTAGNYEMWPYAEYGRHNDALHAAYIVQGMIEYTRWRPAQIDLSRSETYLQTFIAGMGDVRQFSSQSGVNAELAERPARLWGLGMLAFTLADLGNETAAARALAALPKYEFAPGRLANRPGAEPPIDEPRMVAHAALAAAKVPSPSDE